MMNGQQQNGVKSTHGLRPPQISSHPPPAAASKPKAKDDGDSSDEEIKRMSEKTKKYMTHHIAKGTPVQPKFRMQGGRGRGLNKTAILPPNYVCHRCRQPGHLISDCPTNGNPDFDLKKAPKGIPKNLKKENLPEQVEDKFIKSIINDEITYFDTSKGIMEEFQCSVCKDLFDQPSMMPCCKINYCWKCIMQVVQSSHHFKCPNCHEDEISIKHVVPNNLLDKLTKLYKKECIMKRFVKEVEEEVERNNDLAELPKDFNEQIAKFQHVDVNKILESYTTDEEDIKILEEELGLKNIEQEAKEPEKISPDKGTPVKPPMPGMGKMPVKPGMPPRGPGMQRPGMMPQMMKNVPRMAPGMPQPMINPNTMQYMFGYMPQNMPVYPFMGNPDAMKAAMNQRRGSGRKSDPKSDKDRNNKKKRRRDKKLDRKES